MNRIEREGFIVFGHEMLCGGVPNENPMPHESGYIIKEADGSSGSVLVEFYSVDDPRPEATMARDAQTCLFIVESRAELDRFISELSESGDAVWPKR